MLRKVSTNLCVTTRRSYKLGSAELWCPEAFLFKMIKLKRGGGTSSESGGCEMWRLCVTAQFHHKTASTNRDTQWSSHMLKPCWTYSLSRWAWRTIAAWCALEHTTTCQEELLLLLCVFSAQRRTQDLLKFHLIVKAYDQQGSRGTFGPGFPVGPLAPRPPRGPCRDSRVKPDA